MDSFLFGLLGGVIAWFITTMVAQPVNQLLSLRMRAAKLMAMYEEPQWGGPDDDLKPLEAGWVTERKKAYEDCGTDLIAFAFANSWFTRALHRLPAKRFRIYPRTAGSVLTSLPDAPPGTHASLQLCEQIASALKLHYKS